MRVCNCMMVGTAACRYCPNGEAMDASTWVWPRAVRQHAVSVYTVWPSGYYTGNTKDTTERYKS